MERQRYKSLPIAARSLIPDDDRGDERAKRVEELARSERL
jgi:hypothetical protein